MVSPDVVGIGSEYFVVYFRVYIIIYVRLIMSGYLFFCIYFSGISHDIQNEKLWNLHTSKYKVRGEVLVLGLLVVVYLYKIRTAVLCEPGKM